ncbi:hypothetical protein OJ998_00965 [Solirubrobacter taibaiensis]|nr:hypothetical protein [Solirubrobacter taibaiensis]
MSSPPTVQEASFAPPYESAGAAMRRPSVNRPQGWSPRRDLRPPVDDEHADPVGASPHRLAVHRRQRDLVIASLLTKPQPDNGRQHP